MRYILLLIFALITTLASGQVQYLGSPTTTVRNRGNFVSDSLFYLPKRTKAPSDTGAIRYQISDSALYVWTGSAWRTAGTAGSAITGSGVAGYMPEFTTATNIDTTRLYHSNGRFAIGSTTTTNGVFNVYGGNMYADSTTTLSNLFRVDDARRQVGIGTNTPFEEVDIYGKTRIYDTGVAAPNNAYLLQLENPSDGGIEIRFTNSAASSLVNLFAGVESSGAGTNDGVFRIHTALNGTSSERLRVTSNGEVNIGNSSDAGNYTLQNYGGLYSTANTVLAASSGVVSIGTTILSNELLNLYKSDFPYIGIYNSTTGTTSSDGAYIGLNGSVMEVRNKENADLRFYTNNTINAVLTSSAELLINTTTDAGAYALQVAGSIYNTTGAVLAASSGSVGIGTTSPTNILHVAKNQNATTGIVVTNTDATDATSRAGLTLTSATTTGSILSIGTTLPGLHMGTTTNSPIFIFTNGSTKAYLSANGDLGIGTTSPAYKLDIAGTLQSTGNTFLGTSSSEVYVNTTTDAGAYALQVSGAIYNTTTITTGAPTGGSIKPWRLGEAATVSPTSPNRTIRVEIDGTVYYIHAKTTND